MCMDYGFIDTPLLDSMCAQYTLYIIYGGQCPFHDNISHSSMVTNHQI